jgi:hypothetical protein
MIYHQSDLFIPEDHRVPILLVDSEGNLYLNPYSDPNSEAFIQKGEVVNLSWVAPETRTYRAAELKDALIHPELIHPEK